MMMSILLANWLELHAELERQLITFEGYYCDAFQGYLLIFCIYMHILCRVSNMGSLYLSQLCLYLASSYGAQAVFLSPIYVWTVPTLIVTSIFMTSQIKPRKL